LKGIKKKIEQNEIVLSDKWEVDGFIKRIGGKDETIPVNILEISSGEVIYNCETDELMAKNLLFISVYDIPSSFLTFVSIRSFSFLYIS
jgi:hypothetical protein